VLLFNSKRQYIYAWNPHHKFFEVVSPFTATGLGEVKPLVDIITPLVIGATKDPTEKESKYSVSTCILPWTTSLVVMKSCVILGMEVGKEL
jgi:hypothetical protein